MDFLEYRNDDNITYSEHDGGCSINNSSSIVLLRKPENSRILLRFFDDFEKRLKGMLFRLLSTPYGELYSTFGNLDHFDEQADSRANELFGLLTAEHSGVPTYSNIRKSSLVRSMVDIGMISPFTPHGKPRQRMIRGSGPLANVISELARDEQLKLLRNLVDNYEVDDFLALHSKVGMANLRSALLDAKDPFESLSMIAQCTLSDLGKSKSRNHEYAPIWFAQYLAFRGVWLLPMSYCKAVRTSYPFKLLPILCWMAVPDDCGPIAENICSLARVGQKTGATTELCVHAFVASALASDMWRSRRFCPAPLVRLKETNPSTGISAAANHVYNYLANLFHADLSRRNDRPVFQNSKRLDAAATAAFRWCFEPNPRNTKLIRKILKREVQSVPPHVQAWARELTPLLRHYAVKRVDAVIKALSIWLCYLMTLDENSAPLSFADIRRRDHVNDLNPSSNTFANFLTANFTKQRAELGKRALSKIAVAWRFASTAEGFDRAMASPFDVEMDSPVIAPEYRNRSSSTSRSAMEFSVFFLILTENRKNFYEFARSIPRYTKRLRNPNTGLMDDVFWPVEALIIDVILSTGSRGMDARWLDSGEGDEKAVDIDHLREVDNLLATATSRRKAGFVRLVPVHGQKSVLGMFRSSNKTGNLEEVPYIDEDLARNFQTFVKSQSLYNPIVHPVRLVDQRDYSPHAREELFDWVYPAFRNLFGTSNSAISPERLWTYWKALLTHCQPLVNELLGYDYPLIVGNKAVFDLHSLRVTLVTFLLDEGVNPDFVRRIVGHRSLIMTWYYHAVRTKALNDNVRQAIDRMKSIADRGAAGDKAALRELADTVYVDPKAKSTTEGVKRLRELAATNEPARYRIERFDHGLCMGGKCEEGKGNGRGVWRTRACGECMFRATGPHFIDGIIDRANSLMLEIKDSFTQSADYNRRIEELEETTGQTQHAMRQNILTLDRDRERLCLEWAIEVKTALAVEARLLETLDAETPSSASAQELLRAPNNSNKAITLLEADDIELLFTLVRDCHDNPLSELHMPSARVREFLGKVQRMVMVNKLDDLVYKIPASSKSEQLIRFFGVTLKNVGASKVREFMELSEDLQVSPEMVAPEFRKTLADNVKQRALEYAD